MTGDTEERSRVEYEWVRENWLHPDEDTWVRVDPDGRENRRGPITVMELEILAVICRDGDHWSARFVAAESPEVEISRDSRYDLMDEVERLLEVEPVVTKSQEMEEPTAADRDTDPTTQVLKGRVAAVWKPMTTVKDTDLTAARHVRLFREAQSRAGNVASDLDDLEWIHATDEGVKKSLEKICGEAAQVVEILLELSGSPSLLVCPTGMELKVSKEGEGAAHE